MCTYLLSYPHISFILSIFIKDHDFLHFRRSGLARASRESNGRHPGAHGPGKGHNRPLKWEEGTKGGGEEKYEINLELMGDLNLHLSHGSLKAVFNKFAVIKTLDYSSICCCPHCQVEPEPIEGACTRSPFIKHMILYGQDKRELVRWFRLLVQQIGLCFDSN